MKDLEKFKRDCLLRKCNRHTFTSKQCDKEIKQTQCFDKYIRQLEKDKNKQEQKQLEKLEDWEVKKEKYENGEITKEELFNSDLELLKVYKQVDERDKYQCVFWNNFLTLEQKNFIIHTFHYEYVQLFKIIDHAHLEGIGRNTELKYDVNNIICLSRLFHTRIDNYLDPITNKPITEQERQKYINMFKKYVRDLN